jgi:hypothetical protein
MVELERVGLLIHLAGSVRFELTDDVARLRFSRPLPLIHSANYQWGDWRESDSRKAVHSRRHCHYATATILRSNTLEHLQGLEPWHLAWRASMLAVEHHRCMVKVRGFGPLTSWSQARRSTRLSYTLNGQDGWIRTNIIPRSGWGTMTRLGDILMTSPVGLESAILTIYSRSRCHYVTEAWTLFNC